MLLSRAKCHVQRMYRAIVAIGVVAGGFLLAVLLALAALRRLA